MNRWVPKVRMANAAGDNCGTGAGGFRPGNTCGKGGGSGGGTDTAAFREWFGKSKTVGYKGRPKVFYHGTSNPGFTEFKTGRDGAVGPGIYLAENPNKASFWAGVSESSITPGKLNVRKEGGGVYKLHARIENPYKVDIYDPASMEFAKSGAARAAGHDGLYVPATMEWVVWDPAQVKSVLNRGTWSRTDPHISNSLANADDDEDTWFSEPVPFKEAVKYVADKHLLPTTLSSEELMALDPAVRERALFSARTSNAWYLQRQKDIIDHIVNPVDAGGKPWTGVNAGSARAQLEDALRSIGYVPAPGDKGTIKDLGSDQRLNLIVSTQTDMAHGFGQRAQSMTPDALEMFPAYEFYRAEERKEPRDWPERWALAEGQFFEGDSDYSAGRMIALKDSDIWETISAFGLPYPPFDFGSGMDLRQVSRRECIELGIIDDDWEPEAEEDALDPDDFAEGAEASAEQFDPEVLEALVQSLGAVAGAAYGVVEGVLSLLNEALANAEEQPRDSAGRWVSEDAAGDPAGEPGGKIKHAVMVIGGKRYRGPTHMQALDDWLKETGKDYAPEDTEWKEGFETESGHYLNRKQAAEYSTRQKQVTSAPGKDRTKLMSKDIQLVAHEGLCYTRDALANAEGGGVACGESYISGDKVCRVGGLAEDSTATAKELKAAGIGNLQSGNCWVFAASQWQKLRDAGMDPVILNWGGHVEAAVARPGGGYTAYTTEGPRPAEKLGIAALRPATAGKPLQVHKTAQDMLDSVKTGALTGYWYDARLKPQFDKAKKLLGAKWNTEPDPAMSNSLAEAEAIVADIFNQADRALCAA